LHVLMLTAAFFPSGQTAHVLDLARGLVRRGHRVDLWVTHSRGGGQAHAGTVAALEEAGVVVRFLPAPVVGERAGLPVERYDVVHAQSSWSFELGRRLAEMLDIRPPDPERPIRTLSGGNQQKAVLARWLLGGRKLLLLDEPTRGVDVGARAELYAVIRDLAEQGIGVLLVSSEVPEVLGLADRVLVLREGRVIHEDEAAELDEHRVLDMIMNGRAA